MGYSLIDVRGRAEAVVAPERQHRDVYPHITIGLVPMGK
jgi:hypothetical protein